ncbi:hypothetical protein F4818DRAFT_302553 [Hypoxylon cercidicola]|nr:hypothetical protein F4818DRAFT_302553 [Hypoxylon cercidicola]
MPAVNLPPQETHGNVTLYPVPGAQLRLLYRTTPFLLGLLSLGVLFTLRIVLKRKYKPPSHTYTSWTSEEKSSRISSLNDIMSINQPSGFSTLRSTEELGDGGKRRSRDGSKERENGNALEEEMNTSVNIDAGTPLVLKSGPPPPLPLTPPTLLTGLFTFQDRRLSTAVSSMGDLDTSFFSQPNPDYTLSPTPTSDSASTALTHGHDSPSIPRRRSYTKMLPLGPGHADSEHDGASFSPSSFPSSSPILPLAPHESLDGREIDVKGEIISVMNDSGSGWKRHTRVYGGGVCLACLASGSQGGFYGDNVPPEHRR